MTIAALYGYRYNGAQPARKDDGTALLKESLRLAGHTILDVNPEDTLPDGVELMLSIGGDGTFLRAAAVCAPAGIPVLGVNTGHLGFLSENTPQAVAEALSTGRFSIQERSLISAVLRGKDDSAVALNEISVRRQDGQMLGITVTLDGNVLPTYWADGLLVSTPSGSTAYSLSLGGPIVVPSSKVFIIVPIAPHNLNVRPLIVPEDARISISFKSRSRSISFSADNFSRVIESDSVIDVQLAQFSLKRVCLDDTNFVKALSEKLFWGEDKRNRND